MNLLIALAAFVRSARHESAAGPLWRLATGKLHVPVHIADQAQPRPNPEEGMMNDSVRVMRRARRAAARLAAPQRARTAAAVVAAAVLALVAAACSGSSTGSGGLSNAGGPPSSPSAVGYSACMRSHGLPSFPDPGTNGQVPKAGAQQLGVSTSQLQAAQRACQHLYPTGGSLLQRAQQCAVNSDCSPALLQQWMNAALKLARCMRSRGQPNFPDPTANSSGVVFDISNVGITDAESHSTPFIAKLNACGRVAGSFPESFG